MATAQLPQATIGLSTKPTAAPVSSASITAKNFKEDNSEKSSPLLTALSFIALALALIFVGYQCATDTLDYRTQPGWFGGLPISAEPKPAIPASTTAGDDGADAATDAADVAEEDTAEDTEEFADEEDADAEE